jgi:hypothetical protein
MLGCKDDGMLGRKCEKMPRHYWFEKKSLPMMGFSAGFGFLRK